MIIYSVLIVAILIVLHIYIRYLRFGRLLNAIPGPKPLPFVGNLLSFNIPTDKVWIKLHELQDEYPIFKLWSFFSVLVITRDPDDVKALLSSSTNINKDMDGYNNIKCGGHSGLVIHNGKLWENRRKILNPAFSLKLLNLYSETLNRRTKRFTDQLLSHDKIAVHDVSKVFLKFAFEVVCEATMGFDLDEAMQEKGNDFRNAFIEVGEICYYRVARPYIQDWMMRFLPVGRRQEKLWKTLVEFAGKIVDERRKYHKNMDCKVSQDYLNNNEKGLEDDGKVTKRNLSVLDALLLSEEKGLIDSKGVLDETIIMIAAGFETTGVAIMFLIILLAENQKAQDLAREELLDVLGGFDNEITNDHIKKLEYLDRCAKESMRLFTVTPYIGRSIDEDIQFGKYTIPVGTAVYINMFDLHRDPNLWHDPLKFDPDRFLPENMKQQHSFAYIPFSRGPRSCIGQKLAMNEVKTIVAHLLYNFHLEAIDHSADFKFDLGVTLQLDKARVRFTKIDKIS